MSNKYINVICNASYGAVDSARDKQMKSVGLGLLIGSVALVAVPAILMSSGSMNDGEDFDDIVAGYDAYYAENGITGDYLDIYYELCEKYPENTDEIRQAVEDFYQVQISEE